MAQVIRSKDTATAAQKLNPKQEPSSSHTATPPIHASAGHLHHLQNVASLPITETSSLVLVKSLLTASFGSLAFVRGLFDETNFDDETLLYPSEPEKDLEGGPPKTRKPLRIKKLKRGVTLQADTLLDWITLGVFDSIENKYLQNIIFSIFSDPHNEMDSVEVYTFSFTYTENKIKMDLATSHVGAPLASTVETTSNTLSSNSMSYDNAKRNLYNLVKRFILMAQKLGKLPDSRFLSMRLLYTPETPSEYQPPKFKDCTETPEADFILKSVCSDSKIYATGKSDVGHYSLSMKIVSNPHNYKNAPVLRTQSTSAYFGAKNKLQPPPVVNKEIDVTPWNYKQMAAGRLHSRLNSTTSGSQIKIGNDLQTMFQDKQVDEITMTQPLDATSAASDENVKSVNKDLHEQQTPYKLTPMVTSSSSSPRVAETFKNKHYTINNNAENFSCACGQEATTIFDGVQCTKCNGWVHKFCEGYYREGAHDCDAFEHCLFCQLQIKLDRDLTKPDLEGLRKTAIARKVLGFILKSNLTSNKPLRHVFEAEIGNVSSLVNASSTLKDICSDLGLGLKDLENVVNVLTEEKVFFANSNHQESSQSGAESSPSISSSQISLLRRFSKSWRRFTALRLRYFTPGLELQPIPENVTQFLRERRKTLLSEESRKENENEEDTTMVDIGAPQVLPTGLEKEGKPQNVVSDSASSKKKKVKAGAQSAETKKTASKVIKARSNNVRKKRS